QGAVPAAEIGAALNGAGRVVPRPADGEQCALSEAAVRRAAEESGEKAVHRTRKNGSPTAAADEEPGPCGSGWTAPAPAAPSTARQAARGGTRDAPHGTGPETGAGQGVRVGRVPPAPAPAPGARPAGPRPGRPRNRRRPGRTASIRTGPDQAGTTVSRVRRPRRRRRLRDRRACGRSPRGGSTAGRPAPACDEGGTPPGTAHPLRGARGAPPGLDRGRGTARGEHSARSAVQRPAKAR